ncbi:MAG TPA: biotin/lipoate A/B protein ligase family protein [Spirochaetia bacterium]
MIPVPNAGQGDAGRAPTFDRMHYRLIVHPKMEGRLDMAVDEALSETVGAGTSVPTVRLYGFSPATLSLGRFQRIKGAYSADALASDGVTLVRRPTGGHAVLHDDELTYSVTLPKSEGGSLIGGTRKREVYAFIARILLDGLSRLGVTGSVASSQRGDLHNPDCFGSTGEYEIAGKDGRKLIGSAQMTTRHAILQHGSIPLSNPGNKVGRYIEAGAPIETHVPSSLDEELGRALTFDEVRDAFAAAFRALLSTEDSDLTPAESARAREILAAKYATDAWNLQC